jgi:hypothetical protein
MAWRMMEAAETLLREGSRSSAFRRRAISTAYYASFHAIARLCADHLSRGTSRDDPTYERIYRALEHGSMKKAFSESPIRDNERLRKIGASLTQLQAERFKADYMPPARGMFSYIKAEEMLDLARGVITDVESIRINSNECRLLAANLLFRDRRS